MKKRTGVVRAEIREDFFCPQRLRKQSLIRQVRAWTEKMLKFFEEIVPHKPSKPLTHTDNESSPVLCLQKMILDKQFDRTNNFIYAELYCPRKEGRTPCSGLGLEMKLLFCPH